jgi:hypothetical protein
MLKSLILFFFFTILGLLAAVNSTFAMYVFVGFGVVTMAVDLTEFFIDKDD